MLRVNCDGLEHASQRYYQRLPSPLLGTGILDESVEQNVLWYLTVSPHLARSKGISAEEHPFSRIKSQ